MQDPNWSELVKYCAARGAYRGAGSESLGMLVRNQPLEDSYLPGEDQGMRLPCTKARTLLLLCVTLMGPHLARSFAFLLLSESGVPDCLHAMLGLMGCSWSWHCVTMHSWLVCIAIPLSLS